MLIILPSPPYFPSFSKGINWLTCFPLPSCCKQLSGNAWSVIEKGRNRNDVWKQLKLDYYESRYGKIDKERTKNTFWIDVRMCAYTNGNKTNHQYTDFIAGGFYSSNDRLIFTFLFRFFAIWFCFVF